MSRDAGDIRYHQSATTMNNLPGVTTDLDVLGHRVTGVGIPTTAADLASK
jgi:hypothetical protein